MTESKLSFKESALNSLEYIGVALIVYGVYLIVGTARVSGFLLELFVLLLMRIASEFTTEEVVHRVLAGHAVAEFVENDPMSFDPTTPLTAFRKLPRKFRDQLIFPVARTEDHGLIGLVDVRSSSRFPASEWNTHSIAEITKPCSEELTVTPDADAEATLMKMQMLGLRELLVVRGGRLLGVLRQNTLLKQIQEGLVLTGPQQA